MTQQLAQWACLVMLVLWLGMLLCLVVHCVASREADSAANLTVVIGWKGISPDRYWCVKVDYGSCSGCDTLESIRRYDQGQPSSKQVDEYMTLALHIVQQLREMEGESV